MSIATNVPTLSPTQAVQIAISLLPNEEPGRSATPALSGEVEAGALLPVVSLPAPPPDPLPVVGVEVPLVPLPLVVVVVTAAVQTSRE